MSPGVRSYSVNQKGESELLTKVNQQIKYLGIDAGGTFTDFVLVDGEHWRIHKVLSTPENPARAILQGINDLQLMGSIEAGEVCIVHGSTVATNAILERKEARTVYVANRGFKDVLTIGRQARQELYNLNPEPVAPPVPSELCLEVDCRRDAKGRVIQALSTESLDALIHQIDTAAPEAVAINLLFSFANDDEERQIESALKDRYFISRSSVVLPKYKEYERGIATWLNASLGPKVGYYMRHLMRTLSDCPISIMQSSGGTIAIDQASNRAVNLLLSGPAGGLAAVRTLGQLCDSPRLISFDMGGTSTDVALMDGDFHLTDEGRIDNWPVAVPMLEMSTIGAGGGSIAWLDHGNMLHVGPKSAGSNPGPACYDLGGDTPTVTDANVVLGRLRPEAFLGGEMALNAQRSIEVIDQLAAKLAMGSVALALGIINIAEQQMVRALHGISIQKGYDPADFTLCCFGGAGGMHVCSLAEQLHMTKAIVPLNSGVLSAYGMLTAPRQRQLSQTHLADWSDIKFSTLEQQFQTLEDSGYAELLKERVMPDQVDSSRSLDLRYQGQSYTLNIPFSEHAATDFIDRHRRQYGHTLDTPVELVNLCVLLKATPGVQEPSVRPRRPKPERKHRIENRVDIPSESEQIPVYQRDDLAQNCHLIGPAIIVETVSTTWLKSGWTLTVDQFGNLILSRED